MSVLLRRLELLTSHLKQPYRQRVGFINKHFSQNCFKSMKISFAGRLAGGSIHGQSIPAENLRQLKEDKSLFSRTTQINPQPKAIP